MKNYPTPDENGRYSWETYVQLEAESELRYEYHDGEIVAMAGASLIHNTIITNCNLIIKPAARTSGCRSFTSEVKVFRPNKKEYYYPDVVVTCNPLDLQSKDGVRSPLLVIEVLSKSTRSRDVTVKLREYLRIPSLKHYLIIEQTRCEVLYYNKNERGEWVINIFDDMEQKIPLPELEAELRLSDIYEEIIFGPEPDVVEELPGEYERQAGV